MPQVLLVTLSVPMLIISTTIAKMALLQLVPIAVRFFNTLDPTMRLPRLLARLSQTLLVPPSCPTLVKMATRILIGSFLKLARCLCFNGIGICVPHPTSMFAFVLTSTLVLFCLASASLINLDTAFRQSEPVSYEAWLHDSGLEYQESRLCNLFESIRIRCPSEGAFGQAQAGFGITWL